MDRVSVGLGWFASFCFFFYLARLGVGTGKNHRLEFGFGEWGIEAAGSLRLLGVIAFVFFFYLLNLYYRTLAGYIPFVSLARLFSVFFFLLWWVYR